MSQHRHRAHKSTTRPFFGPVAARQNRAAHGGHCVRQECRCGAQRQVNVNGRHVERGAWEPAEVAS